MRHVSTSFCLTLNCCGAKKTHSRNAAVGGGVGGGLPDPFFASSFFLPAVVGPPTVFWGLGGSPFKKFSPSPPSPEKGKNPGRGIGGGFFGFSEALRGSLFSLSPLPAGGGGGGGVWGDYAG